MGYRLIHDDCLNALPTLAAGSVDLVLADPPFGITAQKWDAVIPFGPMWEQLRRVAKPNAAIVLFASQPFTSALVMSNPREFRHEWIWGKNFGGNFMNTVREPMKEHESVLVFSAGGWTYNKQMQERSPEGQGRANRASYAPIREDNLYRPGLVGRARRTRPRLRVPSSVQRFNVERGLHPTQKPVALMAYLIRTYSNPGDVVLDFCFGSASTGVAAVQEGREFIGIEREAEYYEIGRRRLAAAQPPLPMAAD